MGFLDDEGVGFLDYEGDHGVMDGEWRSGFRVGI